MATPPKDFQSGESASHHPTPYEHKVSKMMEEMREEMEEEDMEMMMMMMMLRERTLERMMMTHRERSMMRMMRERHGEEIGMMMDMMPMPERGMMDMMDIMEHMRRMMDMGMMRHMDIGMMRHMMREEEMDMIRDMMEMRRRMRRDMDMMISLRPPSPEMSSKTSPGLQHLYTQQTPPLQRHSLRSPSNSVDIIGETSLSVTNEEQTFIWTGYGLKLHIPSASLPAGVVQSNIEIKASLAGEFNFPENTTLVSAVYGLHSPVQFSQPIAVEIEHCAIPSDDPSLIFARASQEEPPYKFTALEGGLFPHDSCYACIQLSRFSRVGAFRKFLKGLLPQRRYCAHVYYTRKVQNVWRAHFVITQHLDAYITAVENKYKEAVSPLVFGIAFEKEEIALEVPREGFTVPEQWTITPLTHPGIAKEEVDSFRCGRLLPSCQLLIQWEGKSKPKNLTCMVGLKGAKQPRNFFLIALQCTEDFSSQTQQSYSGEERVGEGRKKKGSIPSTSKDEHMSPPVQESIDKRRQDEAGPSIPNRPRNSDRAVKLEDLIHHVTIPRWFNLGLALKVDEDTLEFIKADTQGDSQTGLRRMFQEWLKGCQQPSWNDIVQALWQIGEKQRSTQINKFFCYSTLD